MWKKISVIVFTLLGTFSVIYVTSRELFASSVTYSSGGVVTGRVNMGPTSSDHSVVISGEHIGMQKGDKLLLGMKDKENKPIAWQLLKQHEYNTYNRDGSGNIVVNDASPTIRAWFAGSEGSTGRVQPYDAAPTSVCTSYGGMNRFSVINYLTTSNLYTKIIKPINDQMKEADLKLVQPRNLKTTSLPGIFGERQNIGAYLESLRTNFEAGKSVFTLAPAEFLSATAGDNNVNNDTVNGNHRDRAANISIDKVYWMNTYFCNGSTIFSVSPTGEWLDGSITSMPVNWNIENDTRTFVYLGTEDIVFAVSQGSGTGFGTIQETSFESDYYKTELLSTVTSAYKGMKARVYNPDLHVELKGIVSKSENAISTTTENNTIKLKVDANTIETTEGTNTLSVLVFENNHFAYYKPLEPTQDGEHIYEFDTTGMAANTTYQIGVVNEIYNEQSLSPADSSKISNVMELKIVDSISNVTFEAETNLVHGFNVDAQDRVGVLSAENGTGSPVFELAADPQHPSDVDKFAIAEDGKTVVVKDTALSAGTYYFKVKAQDQDGMPSPALEIFASIEVGKGEAQITFPSETVEKYKDDEPFTLAFTHTNTDTSDSAFSISYNSSLNTIATVDEPSDTQDLDMLVTPLEAGTTTITVSISETSNFKATSKSFTLKIHPALTAQFLAVSDSIAVSSLTSSGSLVGNVTVTGNTPNYTYSMESDPDDPDAAQHNSLFTVRSEEETAENRMQIITNQANLPHNTYKITVKIVDCKGKVAYAKGSIRVVGEAQSGFEFYNYNDLTMDTPVTGTTIDIAFNENARLIASGGTSSGSITYGLADGERDDIIDVAPDTGELTIHTCGRVKVQATKAGDSTHSPKTIYMYINIVQAKQTIAFEDASPTKQVRKGSASFTELAIGSLTLGSDTDTCVGGIRYKSSNSSVIEIDPITGSMDVGDIGEATITATLNENDPSNTDYNANYETATATKRIRVYEGISATWNPAPVALQAGNTAVRDAVAGTINVENNNGQVEYSVVEDTGNPNNADGDKFYMEGSSLSLISAISGSDIAQHLVGGNTFKVQVVVSDSLSSYTVDCEVVIGDAPNTVHFMKNGETIQEISYRYGEVTTIPLNTTSLNSGVVEYTIAENAAEDIVSIDGSTLTILKAGETIVQATVAAGNGFLEGSATLRVRIEKGIQEISFINGTDTVYHAYSEDGSSISEGATLTGNTSGSIQYTSLTPNICTYTSPGTITALSVGNCEIQVANSDADYEAVSARKTIVFYTGTNVSFTQNADQILQAGSSATASTSVGVIDVQGGPEGTTYVYEIHEGSESANAHASYVNVDPTFGTLSLRADVNAADIASATYDADRKSYIMRVQVDVTDETTNEVVVKDCEIEIKGAQLDGVGFNDGEGRVTNRITRAYSPNGSISISLVGNAGNGRASYEVKEGSPSDVIDEEINGNVLTIRNANEDGNSTPVMIVATIAAKNGYEETTTECEVKITRAEQSRFRFEQNLYILAPGMSIDPVISGIMSKQEDGSPCPYTLHSSNTSMVVADGVSIIAQDTLTDEEGIEITAFVDKDRNYNSATATAHVVISNQPAYNFIIDVPSVTYGESASATIRVSDHTYDAELQQEWTSSDPSVATVDEQGNLTILKAGSTSITCIQRSNLDDPVMSSGVLVVRPKPITITIEDASKKVGEVMPEFVANIPQSEVVGSDTIEQPDMVCLDGEQSVDANTLAGTYPITGSYAQDRYPNYQITMEPGELTVTQDESQSNWFYQVGATSNERFDTIEWHNEDVYVVLDPSAAPYDTFSIDQEQWHPNRVLVNTEGSINTHVHFSNSETQAWATPQETTILIDKTKPEITNIQGTPVEQDAISEFLHNLTFGLFFQPRQEITIEAKDILPTGTNINSGISEVAYEIYAVNKETGQADLQEPYKTGDASLNEDGKAIFSIADVGLYRVCATTEDKAGNPANKKCSDINIKNVNVDIDNDGELEFIDSDTDGCPDLNIVLGEDSEGNPVELNIAEAGKKYPYMNIDSNGDGQPDLNIDSDQDGRADINLVVLKEEDWKPKKCVMESALRGYTQPSEYCTGTSVKPQINIVIDNEEDAIKDQIPALNIDNDGDMKPDINISKDGKTAYLNIANIENWKPLSNYNANGFLYDSIGKGNDDPRPVTNIDTNKDGYPDVNIDFNNDGVPEINIDVDGDGIPDVDIDGNGDGIPDFNLDPDEDGNPTKNVVTIEVWKPEKTDCKKDDVEFGTMVIERVLILEDNDVQVEHGNGQFLPNSAIKVQDITTELDDTIKDQLYKKAGDQEIKKVYDIKYIENEVETQPDGSVKVKIPVNPMIKNAKILVEKENGVFEEVRFTEKDGYYEFETSFIGKVSVLGDVEDTEKPTPEPTPKPEPTPTKPSTDVQGNYTNNTKQPTAMGGANTGDSTSIYLYIGLITTSCCMLCVCKRKKKS